MRIALCLSGQPRTWRSTRASQMAYFAGHEVDVFFHTWREGDPAELEALVAAYAPQAYAVTDRPLFVAEKRLLAQRFPSRPPLTVFDMFHSVEQSLKLALAEGDGAYDLVVRARFDAMFDGLWPGEAPGAGELTIPDQYPDASGCNDQFAIGAPAAMRLYAETGAWFAAALPQLVGDDRLRPEGVLLHCLQKVKGLKLRLAPVAMRLCRDDQADLPFARLADDPLFQAAKHEDWERFASEHFPDLLDAIKFDHPSRQPLALDRALSAWSTAHGELAAFEVFGAPWPNRIKAIDAMLDEQTGGLRAFDEDSYRAVRLVCAALLQRMPGEEPLSLESAVLHLLSDNFRDMKRVHAWGGERPGMLDQAMSAAPGGGLLASALAYKPPLTASGHDVWRRRA